MTKTLTSLLLSVFFITSCGFKTDPIPRTSSYLPKPSTSSFIITDDSVSFHNDNPNYLLMVYRAEYSEKCGCPGVYEKVGDVEFDVVFVDRDIKAGERYYYMLRYYEIGSGNYSESIYKNIIYSPPVKVHDVDFYECGNNVCGNFSFSDKYYGAKVFINSELRGIASKQRTDTGELRGYFEVDLPLGSVETLKLLPYDEHLNEGFPYVLENKNVGSSVVQNINVLSSDEVLLITWGAPDGAVEYSVKLSVSGDVFAEHSVRSAVLRIASKQLTNYRCFDISITPIFKSKLGYVNTYPYCFD